MNLVSLIGQGDALTQALAWMLLAMSVASWVVIFWKAWLLHRAARSLPGAISAAWHNLTHPQASQPPLAGHAAGGAPHSRTALLAPGNHDPDSWLEPFVAAPTRARAASAPELHEAELVRALRSALLSAHARLRRGQTLLATVGATAPFVGLLGTVWGIYHALTSLTGGGAMSIDRLAGPVGEALVMTAAGLGVAIPAVLAYNTMARVIADRMAELEGLAHDIRALEQARAASGESAGMGKAAAP